jgi:signal transduction histidine kinase
VSQWLVATKFTFETARLQLQRGDVRKADETLGGGVTRLQEVMRYVREMAHKLRSAMHRRCRSGGHRGPGEP